MPFVLGILVNMRLGFRQQSVKHEAKAQIKPIWSWRRLCLSLFLLFAAIHAAVSYDG
jgi:hypothetical protein